MRNLYTFSYGYSLEDQSNFRKKELVAKKTMLSIAKGLEEEFFSQTEILNQINYSAT